VEEVAFSGGKKDSVNAELTTILDDTSLTPYLNVDSASNCNVMSADGDYWHMITQNGKNELALLSVEVGSKNKATVHTLSPPIAANASMPLGCVWYEDNSEVVMMRFGNAEDNTVVNYFDAIDVSSGKIRRITTWNTGDVTADFSLTAIDDKGHLLVPNVDITGDNLLMVDASVTDKAWSDALVSNATLTEGGFAVGTTSTDTVFISIPDNSDGTTVTFGSASTSDLLKAGKTPVKVTTPKKWEIEDPGRAQVVDDTTLFYSGGSGTWGADAVAYFVYCSIKTPLSAAPTCTNSTEIKRMVWASVVAPPHRTGAGTIVGIVVGSLIGVALCAAGIVWYRRTYGSSAAYTAV
jgi:hypothetical protein